MKALRFAMIPAVAALAALFTVLPVSGGDATVEIVASGGGWRFEPASVQIQPGDRVAFENTSKATHTVTCQSPACWDLGDIQPGQVKMMTFPDAGSFAFVCRYHGAARGLGGTLTVGQPQPGPASPVPSPSP